MRRSGNQRYHDRVAPRYEAIHEGDPYLSFCRELTWRHLKRFLPSAAGARVLDAGCGPGHFGIKLAKSRFAVDFLDLSEGMLDQARAGCAAAGVACGRFVRASLEEADSALRDGEPRGELPRYALVLALGDVVSFVPDPAAALRALHRLLAPGGALVASVDQRYAGIDRLLEAGDGAALDRVERFLADGRTEWLARRADERFPARMFTAPELERMLAAAGFEVASLIGRPVLPLARHRRLLEDPAARRRILAIERGLGPERELFGRASHLEFAARPARRTD